MASLDDEIRKFLVEANRYGYGNENISIVNEGDSSHTIAYENGGWKFHDNFFGGEPYGGREVIFCQNKPVWIMLYYGAVHYKSLTKKIYKFLRVSLRRAPDNAPYRGPNSYTKGNWSYMNHVTGDICRFRGKERVFYMGREVFYTEYQGGIIDQ